MVGWHRELAAVDDRIDQNRSIMGQCISHALRDLAWVFQADSTHADGVGHCGEIGVGERRTIVDEAGGSLFELDESQRTVVEYHDLHWQRVSQVLSLSAWE
jgi:hypothetical protein